VFNSSRQIDAGLLNVGYAEHGPADGPAVILLHGWPFDIYSYVDDAPLLAAKGYRVIIPYLRGHGTTRFLASGTFRNVPKIRRRSGHPPSDGCFKDRKSHPRRF
jgi:pimeloyl-ACP methyl ester carboxylesterase